MRRSTQADEAIMRHSAHLLQRVHVSLTRRREHRRRLALDPCVPDEGRHQRSSESQSDVIRRRLALPPCVLLLGTQELRTRSEQFDLGGGSSALSCSRRLRGHRRLRMEEEREEEEEIV